ncbi:molybdenum cofactor guanylyltransferase [Psychroserpens luteolus]|uniref:molybdenum cofactor guanylyltransferase n=1 Tax=Psychroserpens luteolus TaxID=2855840 RepID=UPI001E5B8038|nr:molybdenum cofactor guanylyltransferase [Psychroserpens luteolus]MCD2257737.1 molybdenum cofactor guanylyltransferase [Psychroserpens luteolus]
MLNQSNITGIILAGGKSSRMGYEKGLVMYKNKPFIAHVIHAAETLVNEVIIVSNNKNYDQFNLKRVNDMMLNTGPLAGLYSGLYHSTTQDNLVLSCDIPLITKELLEQLISKVSVKDDIVQVSVKGRTNPLLAVYKKHCMMSCLKTIESGERRLQTFVNQQNTKTITLKSSLEKYTQNINTRDQLNLLCNDIDN